MKDCCNDKSNFSVNLAIPEVLILPKNQNSVVETKKLTTGTAEGVKSESQCVSLFSTAVTSMARTKIDVDL